MDIIIKSDICFECGSNIDIQNHHVIPEVMGGKKTIPLCQLCHSKIHGPHMLKIQNLASIARSRKIEECKRLGIPHGQGRPINSKESIDKFLNKEKTKLIVDYVKRGYTVRRVSHLVKTSTKTVIKVKKYIKNEILGRTNIEQS